MLAELVQHIVNGLIVGGGYALMGIGLTLIFGIMRVVNFAHGEFFMMGAFFLFTLFSLWGLNFFLASLLSVIGLGGGVWGGGGARGSSCAACGWRPSRSPCSPRWRCP
jgi:branched-subunit amino acid ABC-type transport system permease component